MIETLNTSAERPPTTARFRLLRTTHTETHWEIWYKWFFKNKVAQWGRSEQLKAFSILWIDDFFLKINILCKWRCVICLSVKTEHNPCVPPITSINCSTSLRFYTCSALTRHVILSTHRPHSLSQYISRRYLMCHRGRTWGKWGVTYERAVAMLASVHMLVPPRS